MSNGNGTNPMNWKTILTLIIGAGVTLLMLFAPKVGIMFPVEVQQAIIGLIIALGFIFMRNGLRKLDPDGKPLGTSKTFWTATIGYVVFLISVFLHKVIPPEFTDALGALIATIGGIFLRTGMTDIQKRAIQKGYLPLKPPPAFKKAA